VKPPADDGDVEREIDADDEHGKADRFPKSFQEYGRQERQQHQRERDRMNVAIGDSAPAARKAIPGWHPRVEK